MRHYIFFFDYFDGKGSIPLTNCVHMPHINDVKQLAGRQVGVLPERVFISGWHELSAEDFANFTGVTPTFELSDDWVDQLYGESPFVVQHNDGGYEVYEMTNTDWREVTPDNDQFKLLATLKTHREAETYRRRLHARRVLSGGLT